MLDDYDPEQVLSLYSDHTNHTLPRASSETVSVCERGGAGERRRGREGEGEGREEGGGKGGGEVLLLR